MPVNKKSKPVRLPVKVDSADIAAVNAAIHVYETAKTGTIDRHQAEMLLNRLGFTVEGTEP